MLAADAGAIKQAGLTLRAKIPALKSWCYGLGVMLFSLGLGCFIERRVFFDPTALNDDVRNQIYWLGRIANPDLFQGDYIADYFTQPMLVSPVLHGLYQALSLQANPLVVSQYLPLILVLLATFFLYKFCKTYQDDEAAFWVAFSFNVSIWLMKNLAGGLPRAFAYPLLFCLLWAVQERRWKTLVFTIWLSALIYPPVCLLGLGTFLVWGLRGRGDTALLPARWQCLAWILAGLLPIVLFRVAGHSAQFGPLFTNTLAERMRDFYLGGRVVLFSLPYTVQASFHGVTHLLVMLLNRSPHLYILIPVLVFGLLGILYKRFVRPHTLGFHLPAILGDCLIASAILYVLAWFCLFDLYVPERYLEYTLFMMPSFMVGGFIAMLIRRYIKARRWIAVSFVAIALFGAHFFWRADLLKISGPEKQLYDRLKALPRSALIAAPPGLASNIPLYAQKSVFMSNEAYIPFHQAYYAEMKCRLKDWLSAYYAVRPEPVLSLVRQYHIDYLILQPVDYEDWRLRELPRKSYYAFDDSFFTNLMQSNPKAYYLLNLPSSCFIYVITAFQVIDTKRCWPESQHPSVE